MASTLTPEVREAMRLRRAAIDSQFAELQSPARAFRNMVGERYADCRFENFDVSDTQPAAAVAKAAVLAECQKIAAQIETVIGRGQSVVLAGPVGTGKDHLLACMLREAMKKKISCDFVTGPNLAGMARDLIDRSSSEQDFLARWSNVQLLAISEPDGTKGKVSDHYGEWLFRIVDWRYRQRRAVWLTINARNGIDIESRIGARNLGPDPRTRSDS